MEPINLREWKPRQGVSSGRLFTCGRPGRGTHGRTKVTVADTVIDQWTNGLPNADVLHIVSLLGQKTNGYSEFSYYPFRSSVETGPRPTFEEWLNARYSRRFRVYEFPTTDGRGIAPDTLRASSGRLSELLSTGHIVVVVDSAGAERTARVCEIAGYAPDS